MLMIGHKHNNRSALFNIYSTSAGYYTKKLVELKHGLSKVRILHFDW